VIVEPDDVKETEAPNKFKSDMVSKSSFVETAPRTVSRWSKVSALDVVFILLLVWCVVFAWDYLSTKFLPF